VAKGRGPADAQVAYAVFRKATGYERNGVWYPPDTTAAIFWLKNRRRDQWRDKVDVDQNVQVTVNFQRDPQLWDAIQQEVRPSLVTKLEALPEHAKEAMRLVLEDVPPSSSARSTTVQSSRCLLQRPVASRRCQCAICSNVRRLN